MACRYPYHPKATFLRDYDLPDNLAFPCGNCYFCLKRKHSDWVIRCIHEARTHNKICSVTLTYNEESIPSNYKLSNRDICLFFKRLRKNSKAKIRYFLVGEYGSKTHRPHYHAIIFGLSIDDRDVIERSWNKGFIDCQPFGVSALKYILKYFMKSAYNVSDKAFRESVYSPPDFEICEDYKARKKQEKLFFRYSMRNGIGFDYFSEHYQEIFNEFYIKSTRNSNHLIPRYYRKKLLDLPIPEEEKEFYTELYKENAKEAYEDYIMAISEKTGKIGCDLEIYLRELLKQQEEDGLTLYLRRKKKRRFKKNV